MRIKKLELKNFRGFEELTIDFPEGKSGLAVFVGVNGSGKTSVLEGILDLIHLYYYHLILFQYPKNEKIAQLLYHRILGREDVNINHKEFLIAATVEFENVGIVAFRHEQSANGYFETWPESGELRLSDGSLKNDNDKKGNKDKYLDDKFLANTPFFKFYPTSRYAIKNPDLKTDDSAYSRANVVLSAFEDRLDYNDFFKWFRNAEDFELEQRFHVNKKYKYLPLEAIRKATLLLLPGIEKPRVKRPKEEYAKIELMITKGGKELPLMKLSDGEKSLFTIAGDIIRRIFLTFAYREHIEPEDVLNRFGVVLIDEIEQHLHPSWQRTIIPNLRRTFPNIQFILTTHSPQVLSNVPRENVFILNNFKLEKNKPHTEGRDSNALLEDIFDVPSRPEEEQKELSQLYDAIEKGEKEKAEKLFAVLKKKLGDRDLELLRAENYMDVL